MNHAMSMQYDEVSLQVVWGAKWVLNDVRILHITEGVMQF